jgi:peptidoglycan/LPS O-acetylase OafA/YrhL
MQNSGQTVQAQQYRLGYQSDIEGLRAVAILLVIAAHFKVPWLEGGFVGVDVFFVLSGYLITALLVQELGATGQIRFAAFYARRFRRLLPTLLLTLTFTGLAAAVLLAPGEQPDQARTAASAAVWLSNFHFALSDIDYFGPDSSSNLFLHTWSLGVEEQFYLIWPALLAWLLGRQASKHVKLSIGRLKLAMLAIAGASFLACMVLTQTKPQWAFYMMPTRAWQFALGALVLLFTHGPRRQESSNASGHTQTSAGQGLPAAMPQYPHWLDWLGWSGLGLIVAAAALFDSSMSYPGARALLPTLGTSAILAVGAISAGVVTGVGRLLSWRPLRAIGRVSYSWYLWHWPVLLLGGELVNLANPLYRAGLATLSLLLAVATFRLIESPIRKNARLLRRPGAFILIAIALMIAANVLCIKWFNTATGWMSQPLQQRYLKASADVPAIYAMGCDDWFHSAEVRVCAFGQKDASHTAVLIGDSIAGQWFPALATVFDKPDWRLLVLTKSSCPMVDEPVFYSRIGQIYEVCSVWRKQALKHVVVLRPDIVVLGSTSTYGFDSSQWIEGTSRVLKTISKAAGHIYILRATPGLSFNGLSCLATRDWLPKLSNKRRECSAPSYNQQNTDVFQWLQQAASGFSNVATLDLNDRVCPDGTCNAERNGEPVFRDTQHLTAAFVESLGDELEGKLKLQH